MSEANRFPDSVFDRIGSFLPADQRTSYYRYVAHLRTLNPKDELLVLAEGMAIFACIARQVPEALAGEREKLLTEFARLCAKHETATTSAAANVKDMFSVQQRLLEQNIGTWQNREQQAVQSLDRIAKRFEEIANQCVARLQASSGEIQAAAKEQRTAALLARQWVGSVSLDHRFWPCLASGAIGALIVVLVVYLRTH